VNRYNTESPNPVEQPDLNEPVLMGIMAEILSEELHKENVDTPFFEFPVKSLTESEKKTKVLERIN